MTPYHLTYVSDCWTELSVWSWSLRAAALAPMSATVCAMSLQLSAPEPS